MSYVTKCVATQPRHVKSVPKPFSPNDLSSACGNQAPQPCAAGYKQAGELYAEAGGTCNDKIVFNVVRVCVPEK